MVLLLSASGIIGLSGVVGVGSGHREAASSAAFNACSTACFSRESYVGVCGDPRGVKVGDTASSSIRMVCSILCSRERDEVDWIIDKSSGSSLTKPRH